MHACMYAEDALSYVDSNKNSSIIFKIKFPYAITLYKYEMQINAKSEVKCFDHITLSFDMETVYSVAGAESVQKRFKRTTVKQRILLSRHVC